MKISIETLKETANDGYWRRGRPLPAEMWERLAKAGLYDWASTAQAAYKITGVVPPKEVFDAPAEPLVLEPIPAAAPTPPARSGKPISTRRLNRGRLAAAALDARYNREQSIGYSPGDFVQFALPHKKLDATVYERLNGRLKVTLTTRNGYTIPFGQDRLFPLWLATAFNAAGRPANNTIRFESASHILKAFHQSPDGGSRQALRERIQRWHHTTVDVELTNTPDSVHQLSYSLIEEAHLWFHKSGNSQLTLWQNAIKLHSRFADSLREKVIPIDFETVVVLKDEPGALDLYIWQAHRSWELYNQKADRPTAVPISSLLAQLGTRSEPRKAKEYLKKWQSRIKEIWPACPNYVDGGRNLFMLQPAQAVFQRATVNLPGVRPEALIPVPLRPLSLSADERLVLKPATTPST